MSFVIHKLNIDGPFLIETKRFYDDRGFFEESFREEDRRAIGMPPFVQENHSFSVPPVIRGMHYQLNPKAQGKLVSCVSGSIYDFIVDIRRNSATYGKWEKILLAWNIPKSLYIPPGFAHGFCTFGNDPVHLIYKATEYYDKDLDRCINWGDPQIDIKWGLYGNTARISEKDRNAPLLKDADNNF